MPILWREPERRAVVISHGAFHHVRAKHQASGESVLLMILTHKYDAERQAELWHERLTQNPNAKMHWVGMENYIHDELREDDLRHDADLERGGPQEDV